MSSSPRFPRLLHRNSPLQPYRCLLLSALLLGGQGGLWLHPAFGQVAPETSPAPGTIIENQATGSYVDDADLTNKTIVSDTVTLTVVEVVGITAVGAGMSEAPAGVTNGGTLQGDGTINVGDIAYFDYTITNVGNDPSQFFLPEAPSSVTGGTFNNTTNPIQVIAYNPTGTTSIPVTGVTVPTGGASTGPSTPTGTDGLLGKNGIIPAGGSVTIRVPIQVTAAGGQSLTVILGNTSPNDNTAATQNQVYANDSNQDIYTKDNLDGTTNASGIVVETAGIPLNGDATNHRQEASASQSTTVAANPINITGTVFEDVNYGGGAGRDLSTASGIARPNVRVELYSASGNYLGKTLTDANGKYLFNVLSAPTFAASQTYQVRVVNSFVTSSRTGACVQAANIDFPPAACTQLPVQTFRTNGLTSNVGNADPNRVGGEQSAEVEAPANTTSQTLSNLNGLAGQEVQSLTTVVLGTDAVSGIDFGYNFDTIVNTKDSGQGSLRQFIINSNALANTQLNQVANPSPVSGPAVDPAAGQETSIFMIPRGIATPGLRASLTNQVAGTSNNSGAAVITLLSPLNAITDSNTTIDGFTQTSNVGDTNSGQVGTNPSVGTTNLSVPKVDRPEIVIDGRNLTNSTNADQYALTLNGNNAVLKGIAIYGTKGDYAVSAAGDTGAIRVGSTLGSNVLAAGAAIIEQNLIGTYANGTDPGSILQNQRYGSICFAPCQIQNNYIAFNGYGTVLHGAGASGSKILANEYQSNGPNIAPSANPGVGSAEGDSIAIWSAANIQITGNLIANTRAVSSNTLDGGKGIEIVDSLNNAAINNIISKNTIEKASTAGIGLYNGARQNTISQNIIFNTTPTASSGATPAVGAGILLSASGALSSNSAVTIPNRNTISQNSIYGNQGLGIDLDPRPWLLGDGVTANNGTESTTVPNEGIDYPIITSSTLSGSTLNVKGFVGNNATGSATFAGAILEFFVADNTPANQNGEVILGDGKNLPHGEGRTYIGTCNADGNSLFNCSFPSAGLSNANNVTATARDISGNTSEFNATFNTALSGNPNVILVKRITAINGGTNTVGGNSLTGYIDSSSPFDDNNKWPDISNFLIGGINGGTVRPKDTLEYTIYFLSAGTQTANRVLFCDRVPDNITFIPNAFNPNFDNTNIAADGGGLAGADRGIAVNLGGTLKSYTNVKDGDFAHYYPPGSEPNVDFPNKIDCGGSNTNGAIVVNLGNLPNATAPGTPTGSYGFVRFQGQVK